MKKLIAFLLIAYLPAFAGGRVFNGTSDCAHTNSALTLESTNQVSVLLAINQNTTSGTNIWLESSTNLNLNNGSMAMDPTNYTGGGQLTGSSWEFNFFKSGGYTNYRCNNLASSGITGTHTLATMLNPGVAGSLFIDGGAENGSLNCHIDNNPTGFADFTTYLMSRACSNFFTAGTLYKLAIWDVQFSAAQLHAVSVGVPPQLVWPGSHLRAYYQFGATPGADSSQQKNNLTITGTTAATGMPGLQTPLFPQQGSAY